MDQKTRIKLVSAPKLLIEILKRHTDRLRDRLRVRAAIGRLRNRRCPKGTVKMVAVVVFVWTLLPENTQATIQDEGIRWVLGFLLSRLLLQVP